MKVGFHGKITCWHRFDINHNNPIILYIYICNIILEGVYWDTTHPFAACGANSIRWQENSPTYWQAFRKSSLACPRNTQLTHCGIMMPFGDIDLGQHWLVMAFCLTAPIHYLNQCWLIISEVQWHSYQGKFTRDASTINHWNLFESYMYMSKISFKFPRGQWVNADWQSFRLGRTSIN